MYLVGHQCATTWGAGDLQGSAVLDPNTPMADERGLMDRKTEAVRLRLTANQRRLIKQAAGLEGITEAQFMRDSAYARALFVLIDRNTNSAEVRRLMISLAKRTQEPELVRLTQLLLTTEPGEG